MVTTAEYLVHDRWLSEVLRSNVYRLNTDGDFIKEASTPESAAYRQFKEIRESPVFIYARVSSGNLAAVRFLEGSGFNLIDTTVTFSKPVEPDTCIKGDCEVGFATADDEEEAVTRTGTADEAVTHAGTVDANDANDEEETVPCANDEEAVLRRSSPWPQKES